MRSKDAALGIWGLYAILDKGEGRRGLKFQKEAGNLQVDKKGWPCDKQILAEPPRNNGTQKEVQPTGSAGFLPICHSVHVVMRGDAPSFKQVFLPEFL